MARIADQVISFSVQKSIKSKTLRLVIVARFNRSEKLENMVEQISEIEGVKGFKIE
jgi:nitrate reductase NapAB chaperone NapD